MPDQDKKAGKEANMGITAEICCGGYEDARTAAAYGAQRVELNSGLYLGGLTPGIGTLKLTKETTDLNVVSMVRPRGGGFCYSEEEFCAMLRDAEELLQAGTDGIAFGFLNNDRTINIARTREMTSLIHAYGKTAVFHRAFDCTGANDESMEELIGLCVDRVLTSGGRKTAMDGRLQLRHLVATYGKNIEILAGSGINDLNVRGLIQETGVLQVHSSCHGWRMDQTAQGSDVSYGYADGRYSRMFEVVSSEKLKRFLSAVRDAEMVINDA